MKTAVLVVAALVAALVACGDDDDDVSSDGGGSITVLAAASMTDALTEVGDAFDGGEVTFSFGGSSALVAQVAAGADADVLVTADQSNMDEVEGVEEETVIARNRLAIVVESGNPLGIAGLDDLERDDVVLVMCAPEVPCGRFGALALEKAGVAAEPASLEENVKGVVSKVTLGEADAGIVYVTDVLAAGGDATGVDIDIADDPELEAAYPMAVLPDGDADLARSFVDFVAGDEGQAILREHGFLEP